MWNKPLKDAQWLLVLAHGAGAPMDSPFMQQMAELLAERGIAVVRFEFAYMQARRADGKKRPPNPQKQLLEHWQTVINALSAQWAGRIAIGGKSMGGRMASLLAADELPEAVSALVCLGYPFHPPGKPEKNRTEHWPRIGVPSLIVQGERDPFGKPDEVVHYRLGGQTRLVWLTSGDHDFKPLKASGLSQADNLVAAADALQAFLAQL
nr:alpha/beta family hydrolase [Atopomonas sediminilitoris]